MGRDLRLSELLERLAAVVQFAGDERAASLVGDLGALRGDEWLRLDEFARRAYTDVVQPWTPRGAVWPATGAVPDPAAAIAASMSRDGRVRERAVEWLSGFRGPAVAAAVAVRCGDWVTVVADRARVALPVYEDEQETAVVVGVMLRLVHRRRGWDTAVDYLARVREGDQARLLTLTRTGERACCIWALSAANDRGLLSADDVLDRALRDPDPGLALWCARRLLDSDTSDKAATPADQARLLTSRRALVRAAAVEALPDAELMAQAGYGPRLEPLLLDPSGGVRILARWRWTRVWGPPTSVYRTALDRAMTAAGPGRITRVVCALDGLSECSLSDTVTDAKQLVGDPSPRVRAAAVRVLGRALQRSTVDVDVLLPVLDDSANRVAALAARYLRDRAGEIPAQTVERLSASPRARDRITALRFRQRLGAWERVRSDLATLRDQDLEVRDHGRSDLLAWLQHGAASTYGQPSPAQRHDIAAGLERAAHDGLLTEHQVREIAFAAGLPRPRQAPVTTSAVEPARSAPSSPGIVERLRSMLRRRT